MMTPPLGPSLERKWPTTGDHQGAMLEDRSSSRPLLHHCMQFFVSSLARPHRPIAAPAHHERFRLLGQTAECAAANQRRRRQCCRSSCSLRTPARPQRRAAPSLSSPSRPRRRTPHSLTRRQLVKMPACTPLSCMSPALRSGSVTYGSMPQRTRTPFLRSNTLQQKPRNMNKNLEQKNASPAQRGPRRENMYLNRSRSFAPSLWVR